MKFIYLEKRTLFILLTISSFLFVSCSENKFLFVFNRTKVKNYQPNKPFVYSNKVVVTGNASKDEKNRLTAELNNYWDDSLKVLKLQKFGVFYTIKNPPVFDSINVIRTAKFMNAYLNSQGYYYAQIKDSVPQKKDTVRDQIRTSVIMKIELGKNITIDSVSYTLTDSLHTSLNDSALQTLAMQQFPSSLLKKGRPYTKQAIGDELDRLVSWFKQKGYYKFSREDIFALVDTTNDKLFRLTLDPFEQAKLIAEADKRRRENPTWKIDIRQRIIKDTSKLRKYYVGNIYYYPETKLSDIPDSLIRKKWVRQTINEKGDLILRDHIGKFKMRPLREHTYLRKDSINGEFNEEGYFKTISTLARIPAWKQVDSRIIQRGYDTLDVHFFLEPAIKQNITYNLETSRNSNDFSSGNLLGLALSTTYTNRNVWKQAVQSNTSLRAGIELNFDTVSSRRNLIQTFQIGLGHSYSFPRLITPKFLKLGRKSDNKRTVLAASASYIERFETYRLRQLTGNLTWDWQKKNNAYSWKPLNIELYKIDTLPLLDTIFKQNPFLRNSFNTGNVIGASFTITKSIISKRNPKNSHLIRLGIDESGLLLPIIPLTVIPDLKNKIYQYIKLEADYKFNQKRRKTELAFHVFSGIGIPLGGQSLPFFKQFSAGGPNSMRAWGLRQLGLGSSKASDTISSNSFRDRFGDMQLETNLEYRFTIANINGFKIGSALFADIGNIWNTRKNPSNPGAEFSLDRLGRDIAVAVGTGLRFDLNYFLIRVDFAYKLKDPGRDAHNGWSSEFRWKERRANNNQTEVRNFGFQLGIGLPF